MAFPGSSSNHLSFKHDLSQLAPASQLAYPSTQSNHSPSQLRPISHSNLPDLFPTPPRSSTNDSANTSLDVLSYQQRPALLSKEELQEMNQQPEVNKGDLNRVIQHAVNLESVRQFEQSQYLEQISKAQSKIARLESKLATLSSFRAESSHLDVTRLQVDNDQLTRQAEVLARKLQYAGGGSGQPTINEVNEEEREASTLREENRKLTSDVKYLELRLENSETQACRLSNELRRLRPYYLQGTPLVVHDAEIALVDPSVLKTGSRAVLLGDAEAELLLQAGKSHSHVRRVQRIPIDKAIQLQAEEIVAAVVPEPLDYSQAHPQPHHPPHSDIIQPPAPSSSSSHSHNHVQAQSVPVTAPAPAQVVPAKRQFQLPVPPSLRNRRSDNSEHSVENAFSPEFDPTSHPQPQSSEASTSAVPSQAPPFSRSHSPSISATNHPAFSPPLSSSKQPSPSQVPDSHNSKRRRLSNSEPPEPNPPPPTSQASSFALPLVAPVSSIPPPPLVPTPQPNLGGGAGKPIGRTPSALDLLSEAAGAMRSGGANVIGSNGISYNPRSRKPKIDANGEKKARSPYIKWKLEEDEQLLKAVIECGCAWDSVAKLCPTRAYHQVRQRFLRGLRSGETLPPELMYLQQAVRKAVIDYEARKKRKRPARQISDGLYDQGEDPLMAHYHASQMDDQEQEQEQEGGGGGGGGGEMEDEEYDE